MSDNVNPTSYPAGWYADAANPGSERYYDGTAWTEQTRQTAAVEATPAKRPWYKKKRFIIPIGAFVAIGAIGAIGGAGNEDTTAKSSTVRIDKEAEETVEAAIEEEPEEIIEAPDVVGMTLVEAANALSDAGFEINTTVPGIPSDASDEDQETFVVRATVVTQETDGDIVHLTSTEWDIVPMTLSQKNAVGKAESYLRLMGFSRAGLIQQLEFEDYSTEDATFAADNVEVDWNAEAAEKAQSYLDSMEFSRQGLYDQLAFEEFTPEQIEHALAAVGY